jgi:hypothetical protein
MIMSNACILLCIDIGGKPCFLYMYAKQLVSAFLMTESF